MVQNANDGYDRLDIQAEMVGPDLMIHREIVKQEDGTRAARGETWTVSWKPAGGAVVDKITTRDEARRVAKRLAPFVAAFRAVSQEERQRATSPIFGVDYAKIVRTRETVRELARVELTADMMDDWRGTRLADAQDRELSSK